MRGALGEDLGVCRLERVLGVEGRLTPGRFARIVGPNVLETGGRRRTPPEGQPYRGPWAIETESPTSQLAVEAVAGVGDWQSR
jgi:hypothetical protein